MTPLSIYFIFIIFKIASYLGHFEVVKYLIEQGANVNDRDKYGQTALMEGK